MTLASGVIAAIPVGAVAANPATQWCPVSYNRLLMPIRHQGGVSTPTVELSFTNESKKKIARAKFGLVIIDSQGAQAPYGQALTFTSGADPGKVASAEWALDLEKIDINHMGETVYLKSVRFEDDSTWVDDGFERCREEINFGPK